MGITDIFQRIADDSRPEGPGDSIAQRAAGLFAPVYTAGAYLNRTLHEFGVLGREELPAPVISVGNITLGGTGKTPFCHWLIDFLRAEGRRPAILTRGYGRSDESRLLVVHDGKRLVAGTRVAGDEPVLLARALRDVPVIACSSRAAAGRLALERFEVDTLVLDDGFQHHRLARNGDIVLVDCTKPLSRLELFPRGTLREPVSTLQRAHLIVLTRWQQAPEPERILREVKRAAPGVPIARSRMAVSAALRLSDRQPVRREELRGRRAVLLCAVGNPESVRKSAAELGLQVVGMKTFPDHAPITKAQLLHYDSVRLRKKADVLLVTEKDAVKLVELGNLPPEIIAVRARVEMLQDRDRELAEKVIRGRLKAGIVRGFLR
jgi:tetraacyldisaccharide 4'-kinase